MTFEYPGLLLLLILIVPAWRLLSVKGRRALTILRAAIAALCVIYLAGPRLDVSEEGCDLLVLADRSASMSAESLEDQREILQLLSESKKRKAADRIGVITFAEKAALQSPLQTGGTAARFDRVAAKNGSELSAALTLAAERVSPRRTTRLLVLSDGLYTGADPLGGETLTTLAGLPVWHRHLGRTRIGDVAAGEIGVPASVHEGAGFLVRFSIESQTTAQTEYTLYRDQEVLAKGTAPLERGVNTLFVRDMAERAGVVEYVLETRTEGDTRPENDRSSALLRIVAAPRVLLAASNDTPGALVSALRGASIPVDQISPKTFDWSAARLSPYRVVVLENLPLDALGTDGARALAQAVESGVCSLLVTGGEGSLGQGGYHKSPLDPLLPVTMELREEQRRGRMAMAVVLDRSGSMSIAVEGAMTKMDLANAGTAEAIRLMSPLDQVSVIAVDSAAHVVVPLSEADDTKRLRNTVLKIESQGGGIFVRTALEAAAAQVRKSKLPTRHILLFSDAADSEEQEGCLDLAKTLRREDIGISVVGLGKPGDTDGAFLKSLARQSGGQIYFTDKPSELPRLFSQEVIRVSRRGFVKEPTETILLPDMARLQMADVTEAPKLAGYNLSNLRPGASAAALSKDEYKAPIIAFWQRGRATAGVLAAEVDGPFSGELTTWPHTPRLLVNLVRTLAAQVTRADGKAYAAVRRGNAEIRIELDDALADQMRTRGLKARLLPPAGGGDPIEAPLVWESPSTATVSVTLPAQGHYLPLVDMGAAGVLEAPPLSLPYSSEFMPGRGTDGDEILSALSEATGGRQLAHIDDIFSDRPAAASRATLDLSPWLALLILALLLIEIAERRLFLTDLLTSG